MDENKHWNRNRYYEVKLFCLHFIRNIYYFANLSYKVFTINRLNFQSKVHHCFKVGMQIPFFVFVATFRLVATTFVFRIYNQNMSENLEKGWLFQEFVAW